MLRTLFARHHITATTATAKSAMPSSDHHHHRTTASPFFDAARVYSSTPLPPAFSAAVTDTDAATEALRPLVDPAVGAGRWRLTANGEGIERSFKFATFGKTWVTISFSQSRSDSRDFYQDSDKSTQEFMNAVAEEAKKNKHHPEWSNVYNTTFIRWTTYRPKGLSNKDIDLATTCDVLAKRIGEVDPDNDSRDLSRLADSAVDAAGDCCGSKKN